MSEWKKYEGTDEQIAEMLDAEHGFIVRWGGYVETLKYSGDCSAEYITDKQINQTGTYPVQSIHSGLLKRKNNMKQTIEIDVPEGWEVDYLIPLWSYRETQDVRLFFKKKESEYIEVREYLITTNDGVTVHHSAQKGISNIKLIEESTNFMRWIDQDWRKVEI